VLPTVDGIVVRFEHRDTDGTGVLAVGARSTGFAGDLRSSPFADQRVHIGGGYWTPRGELDEHVGLAARALSRRGQLGVTAHLTVPSGHWAHADGPVCEVFVEVPTSYEALGRFAAELSGLVHGTLEDASLTAEIVA
jgi:hypothetical protein